MTSQQPFRILDLPVELHDNILTFMETESLIAYTLAAYHRLAPRRQRELDYPPVLTRQTVKRLSARAGPVISALSNQPSEVVLLYMLYLGHRDQIAFALADYHRLRKLNITPPISRDIVYGLRVVVLRGG